MLGIGIVLTQDKLCRHKKENFDKAGLMKDIKYFPVARSSRKNTSYVHFINSWGDKRTYGGKRVHEGIDIMGDENIRGKYPVVSMTDGIIENIGWLELGGYRIGIRSKSGGYFYYAHMYSYAKGIEKDKNVIAGQLLGYMGDTGYSKIEGTTGSFDVHLHIGMYINDERGNERSINPYHYLKKIEDSVVVYEY